jgi:hypothetical protein
MIDTDKALEIIKKIQSQYEAGYADDTLAKTLTMELGSLVPSDFAEATLHFAARQDPTLSHYVSAAQTKTKEGDLEIDDSAIVSKGDDSGAYVMAWLWVGDLELEEEP